jgi:hypothetical protein
MPARQIGRASPQIRRLASHLTTHATFGNEASEAKTPAAFHVQVKLRPLLATLI